MTMSQIAMVLYGLAAAGIAALGLRYLTTAVPIGYHAAILAKAGEAPSAAVKQILNSAYRVIGGALLGLALCLGFIGMGPASSGSLRAILFAAAAGLIAGGVSTVAAWRLHAETGERTPWLPAAVLTLVIVIASLVARAGNP